MTCPDGETSCFKIAHCVSVQMDVLTRVIAHVRSRALCVTCRHRGTRASSHCHSRRPARRRIPAMFRCAGTPRPNSPCPWRSAGSRSVDRPPGSDTDRCMGTSSRWDKYRTGDSLPRQKPARGTNRSVCRNTNIPEWGSRDTGDCHVKTGVLWVEIDCPNDKKRISAVPGRLGIRDREQFGRGQRFAHGRRRSHLVHQPDDQPTQHYDRQLSELRARPWHTLVVDHSTAFHR
jgi:hypothetical protein